MRSKNFSSPPVNSRFDFSASGKYKAPYKLEPLLTGIIFGVMGAIALLILIFAAQYAKVNMKADSSDMMLLLAIVVILLLAEALVVAIAMVLVKIVRGGYTCSYIADKERFITNEGGNSRTIYFRDVQSVNFFPKTVFGKVRGYEVNVRLNGYEETYSIVSEGFLSEKSTPFYIIVERVEIIRREVVHERYEAEMAKLGSDAQQISPQPEIGRPASSSRLGQDAVMPSVSLSAMAAPAAASAKPDETLTTQTGGENKTYVGSDGRERLYNEIIGLGRFKVMCSRKKTVVLAVITVAAVVIALYFSCAFIDGLVMMALNPYELLYMPFVAGIAVLAAVSMVIIFLIGDECTYRANGREFVITDKKGGETHIAYENAQSVHYFNSPLGYKVEILTVYGVISYKCVDKRKRIYEKPEKLPFDIISKNIKK